MNKVYLIYGTISVEPWTEYLLCITNTADKAIQFVREFGLSGQWGNVRYETWQVK